MRLLNLTYTNAFTRIGPQLNQLFTRKDVEIWLIFSFILRLLDLDSAAMNKARFSNIHYTSAPSRRQQELFAVLVQPTFEGIVVLFCNGLNVSVPTIVVGLQEFCIMRIKKLQRKLHFIVMNHLIFSKLHFNCSLNISEDLCFLK